MPTKREFLEQLKRAELVAAVDRFGLTVTDRRVRDVLIEALDSSPQAPTTEAILGVLTQDRMREISKALGVDKRVRDDAAVPERREPSDRPRAAAGPAPGRGPTPRYDSYPSAPHRPRGGPTHGGAAMRPPTKFTPRPDRAPERRSRPSGPPRGKPINIQDGYLFESLKENRLLQFALVTGHEIKGRIRRFDQFTVLVDTGTREILIYKSALSEIASL